MDTIQIFTRAHVQSLSARNGLSAINKPTYHTELQNLWKEVVWEDDPKVGIYLMPIVIPSMITHDVVVVIRSSKRIPEGAFNLLRADIRKIIASEHSLRVVYHHDAPLYEASFD